MNEVVPNQFYGPDVPQLHPEHADKAPFPDIAAWAASGGGGDDWSGGWNAELADELTLEFKAWLKSRFGDLEDAGAEAVMAGRVPTGVTLALALLDPARTSLLNPPFSLKFEDAPLVSSFGPEMYRPTLIGESHWLRPSEESPEYWDFWRTLRHDLAKVARRRGLQAARRKARRAMRKASR